jgi:hypothetical protein
MPEKVANQFFHGFDFCHNNQTRNFLGDLENAPIDGRFPELANSSFLGPLTRYR